MPINQTGAALLTEREVRQLYKLLNKFYSSKTREGKDAYQCTERGIISNIVLWVKWYATDELDIDLTRKQ